VNEHAHRADAGLVCETPTESPADGPDQPACAGQMPKDREELRRVVEDIFGITVPDAGMCPHHDTPMDYLQRSFFRQEDLLVWASRGGGKTMLAAIATLLDGLFHSPADVLVLGGSFDQSDRLGDYIRAFLLKRPELVEGRMTRERIRLVGGSQIRVVAQSQRAVRGHHVQKIRCDEVDLFNEDVWQAVQFATRSRLPDARADCRGRSAGRLVRGSIEVLSTLHRAGGLMHRLVQRVGAGDPRPATTGSQTPAGYRMVRWCLWEVIERCPPSRSCADCLLADDCLGVARNGDGFFRIDDAIAIKARSSRSAWEAEMLCLGAQRDWLVFQEFSPARHVGAARYVPEWPLYRAVDFGYRSPLVCLWVQVSPDGRVIVIDEYVQTERPLTHHAAEMLRRDPGPVEMTYVDPAGRQRESTSGKACTEILQAGGIPCVWRASNIADGLELIRSVLAPAAGAGRLLIDPRCTRLIEAFGNYHYPPPGSSADPEKPVKDGPDHLIDALRYFFVNRCRPGRRTARSRY